MPNRSSQWSRPRQVKPDLGKTPSPEKNRLMTSAENPIYISDSDDSEGKSSAADPNRGASGTRPAKRPRISPSPSSFSPKPAFRASSDADHPRALALRQAKDDVTRLREENERLQRKLSDQTRQDQAEITALKEMLTATQADVAAAFERSSDAQAELEKKIENLREGHREELHEELSRKEAALLDLASTKAKLEDANAEIARNQLELGRTQTTLTNAESEKAAGQEKAREQEEEITQVRSRVLDLEKQLGNANARITELEEHIDECWVCQQPPEFWDSAREILRRVKESREKSEKEKAAWA